MCRVAIWYSILISFGIISDFNGKINFDSSCDVITNDAEIKSVIIYIIAAFTVWSKMLKQTAIQYYMCLWHLYQKLSHIILNRTTCKMDAENSALVYPSLIFAIRYVLLTSFQHVQMHLFMEWLNVCFFWKLRWLLMMCVTIEKI